MLETQNLPLTESQQTASAVFCDFNQPFPLSPFCRFTGLNDRKLLLIKGTGIGMQLASRQKACNVH